MVVLDRYPSNKVGNFGMLMGYVSSTARDKLHLHACNFSPWHKANEFLAIASNSSKPNQTRERRERREGDAIVHHLLRGRVLRGPAEVQSS